MISLPVSKSYVATLALLLANLTPVYASDMGGTSSYSANYTAHYNGLEIKASHSLEKLSSGHYRETLKARNILGKIDERAEFAVIDRQIVPQAYRYQRSLVGIKRSEKLVFDWPNGRLNFTKGGNKKGTTTEIAIEPGYLDLVTHKLQLRHDLADGLTTLSYPVISKGKLKQYRYEILGSEKLNTQIGPLNTVKVRRIRDNNKRQTTIWLASDWDYLIVKLQHTESGESHRMDIIDGQVNNQPIHSLNTATKRSL